MKLDRMRYFIKNNYELVPLVSFVTIGCVYGIYRIGSILIKDPDVHVKRRRMSEAEADTLLTQQ